MPARADRHTAVRFFEPEFCNTLGYFVIRQRGNHQLSEYRAVPSGQQPRQLYGSHCLA
jgi:hypothetical protein